ncbi:hypothetical protein CEUSTIGMA_g9338.t1 [Chlamydomonas eustigma]|uniref:Uncharacterized protein n=1 Tax=Chlamydomonas eustigma TaxID=1157962 RepID=A0A250XGJ6_9CHLO|nr:hypothetical protein CEUSTIGMA_g9338.t1 [Chlamydomonas eustigma]|eukprot:GAX81910.1 hypothetical protein CEUSTIGMA_g9338.t1 [Chlamydomonas eustigma]
MTTSSTLCLSHQRNSSSTLIRDSKQEDLVLPQLLTAKLGLKHKVCVLGAAHAVIEPSNGLTASTFSSATSYLPRHPGGILRWRGDNTSAKESVKSVEHKPLLHQRSPCDLIMTSHERLLLYQPELVCLKRQLTTSGSSSSTSRMILRGDCNRPYDEVMPEVRGSDDGTSNSSPDSCWLTTPLMRGIKRSIVQKKLGVPNSKLMNAAISSSSGAQALQSSGAQALQSSGAQALQSGKRPQKQRASLLGPPELTEEEASSRTSSGGNHRSVPSTGDKREALIGLASLRCVDRIFCNSRTLHQEASVMTHHPRCGGRSLSHYDDKIQCSLSRADITTRRALKTLHQISTALQQTSSSAGGAAHKDSTSRSRKQQTGHSKLPMIPCCASQSMKGDGTLCPPAAGTTTTGHWLNHTRCWVHLPIIRSTAPSTTTMTLSTATCECNHRVLHTCKKGEQGTEDTTEVNEAPNEGPANEGPAN